MNRARSPGCGSVDPEKELAAADDAIAVRYPASLGVFPWNRRALALLWYCNMIQLGRNASADDLRRFARVDSASEFSLSHLGHVTTWSRS